MPYTNLKKIFTILLVICVLVFVLISLNLSRADFLFEMVLNISDCEPRCKMDLNRTGTAASNSTTGKIQLKIILFWNDCYSDKSYDFGYGQEPFIQAGCKVSNCFTTSNRSFLPQDKYDAILIHTRSGYFPGDIPTKKPRSPHQRYIMWQMESPQNDPVILSNFKNYFNWTMTYRVDSDIPIPYGRLEPLKRVPKGSSLKETVRTLTAKGPNFAQGKTKLVAWFVSHCNALSKRELYAKALGEHIQVDIYGDCGKYKCKLENALDCYNKLEKDYKFYLSFENSLCEDYVTEKFFSIMNFTVLPVVLGGGANYSRIAPEHSYINTADFNSPKELADYLLKLDKDDQLYNEYFWWKEYFSLHIIYNEQNWWTSRAQREMSRQMRARSMCELCEKLNDPLQPRQMYTDIVEWWNKQVYCTSWDGNTSKGQTFHTLKNSSVIKIFI